MASSLNLDNTKGDTFDAVEFQYKMNGTPINLTGATIKMQLKKSYCDTNAVLSLTSVGSAGITIVNAANGTFKINKQIINIPVYNYVYDIQLTLADGTVKTYVKGNFNITEEVTV